MLLSVNRVSSIMVRQPLTPLYFKGRNKVNRGCFNINDSYTVRLKNIMDRLAN